MDINSYAVVNEGGNWHVRYVETRHGPFRNQVEAIAAAKSWASKNVPSAVVLQLAPDHFCRVWSSSDDPLPRIR